MKLYWRQAGSCKAIEALTIRGGRWKVSDYPSKFALFCHPQKGWCLFDTGYAPRFLEATAHFPYKLYELTTPVSISHQESACEQVRALGVNPEDINFIIVSHLHADHIAGLHDFRNAVFVTSAEGYQSFVSLDGLAAVRKGYLPQLLPSDFESRAHWVEGPTDLWADGSVQLIPLPGHARGQMGALIQSEMGPLLLCADAVWHSRSYRENIDLPLLTQLLLSDSREAFRESLAYLHHFHRQNPNTLILPSHCCEIVI